MAKKFCKFCGANSLIKFGSVRGQKRLKCNACTRTNLLKNDEKTAQKKDEFSQKTYEKFILQPLLASVQEPFLDAFIACQNQCHNG